MIVRWLSTAVSATVRRLCGLKIEPTRTEAGGLIHAIRTPRLQPQARLGLGLVGVAATVTARMQ